MPIFAQPDNFEEIASACTIPMTLVARDATMPSAEDRSATITFCIRGTTCYAVTAGHVVDIALEGGKKFFLRWDGKWRHLEATRFQRSSIKDLAAAPVTPEFLAYLGKNPVVLRNEHIGKPPSHGIAVGYPEELTTTGMVQGSGVLVGTARVDVVAEYASMSESGRIVLYSPVDQAPIAKSLSGMSGGPVFMTDETRASLWGITSEGVAGPSEDWPENKVWWHAEQCLSKDWEAAWPE